MSIEVKRIIPRLLGDRKPQVTAEQKAAAIAAVSASPALRFVVQHLNDLGTVSPRWIHALTKDIAERQKAIDHVTIAGLAVKTKDGALTITDAGRDFSSNLDPRAK